MLAGGQRPRKITSAASVDQFSRTFRTCIKEPGQDRETLTKLPQGSTKSSMQYHHTARCKADLAKIEGLFLDSAVCERLTE